MGEDNVEFQYESIYQLSHFCFSLGSYYGRPVYYGRPAYYGRPGYYGKSPVVFVPSPVLVRRPFVAPFIAYGR